LYDIASQAYRAISILHMMSALQIKEQSLPKQMVLILALYDAGKLMTA